MGQDLDAALAATGDDHITAREVSRITGLSRDGVRAAAKAGHLTSFVPPAGVSSFVRYSRASAEALARSMIRPATVATDSTDGGPRSA